MNYLTDEFLYNGKIYYTNRIVGFSYSSLIEMAKFIEEFNNKKPVVVGSELSLWNILPNDLQYRHILSFTNKEYFETDFMGFHVTTDKFLLDKLIEISHSKEKTEHPLFFASFNENNDVMNYIGYIALC